MRQFEIPSNIRQKPSLLPFLKKFPLLFMLFEGTAQGIYPYIWIPKEVYKNLESHSPDHYHISLIIHEQEHLNRQKGKWLNWMFQYIFSRRFRFNEELIANQEQMKYLKDHKLLFPFEMKAKLLSSWVYLFPISYEEALKKLKESWKLL